MARARIYIRRSDDDQSGYSPEAQERQNRLWCELHGHEVAGVYIDDDLSGRKEGREGFQRLIQDARGDPASLVVVHKIDRFARDAETTLRTIKRFDAAGVSLISVMEQMDFSTPFGRMMLTNLAAWAEFYSRNLGTEIRKGYLEKAQQGGWIGPIPFGYQSAHEVDSKGERIKGTHRLVPSPDAETLPILFHLYASGNESDASIAEELNRRELTLPTRSGQRIAFSKDTVGGMLTNPVYIGIVTYNGVQYPGAHQPLIETNLWDQCQTIRQRRQRHGQSPLRGIGGLLSEFAFCADCGGVLHWHESGRESSRNAYYRCSTYRKFGASVCNPAMIKASVVHEQMLDYMYALSLPQSVQDAVIAEVQRRIVPVTAPIRDRQRVAEQLRRLRVAYRSGDPDLTDEIFVRERQRLEAMLIDEAAPPQGYLDMAKAMRFLGDIPQLLEAAPSQAMRRAIIQQVFSAVWMRPGQIVGVRPTTNYALLIDSVARNLVEAATLAGAKVTVSTFPERWKAWKVPA